MASENLTALAAQFGAYFLQNKDVILALICKDPILQQQFNVLEGVKDEVALPSVTIGANIVQPGDSQNFTPTNNAIVWGGRKLKVRDCKVDLTLDPKQYEKQWLAFTMPKGSQQEKIPYQEFVMMKLVEKIRQAVYRLTIYQGIYNGSGTSTADCFDGFLELIAAEVLASNITEVGTGAITSGNAVDKAYLVYDALDPDYKDENIVMDVNGEIFDWVHRKLNPITNASLQIADISILERKRVNQLQLPGTNCILRRATGLGTSQRMICTLKENMYLGVDTLGEEANIQVEKNHRLLDVMIDFKMGAQLGQIDPEVLSVNDQA